MNNGGTPVAMPVKRLSSTQISMWKQCRARWRYRYVEKLPDPAGVPALLGSFVHRTCELLYQEPPAERTIERARQLAKVAWQESASDPGFEELRLDAETQLAMRWEGWALIERLWQFEDPRTIRVIATERRVEAEIAGVPFLGIVDRTEAVQDGVRIVDYKTGKTPREKDFSQILLYAEAIGVVDGRRPSRGTFLYLKDRALDARVNAIRQRQVVNDLVVVWESIKVSLEGDWFPPETGPLCAWCPYVDRCDEGADFVKERWASGRVRKDAPGLKLLGIGVG